MQVWLWWHSKLNEPIFKISDPVLVDTGMAAVGCQWSHDGSILAVAGTMTVAGAAEKDSNVVQVCNIWKFIHCLFT